MWPALIGAALAASPGGFRVGTGLPVRSVGVREVYVPRVGAASVSQTVLRGDVAFGAAGVGLELPLITTWDNNAGYSDTGLGNLLVAGRWYVGTTRVRHTFGLEAVFPVAPIRGRVTAWGSLSREGVPGVDGLFVYEAALRPDKPVTIRLGLGWHYDPYQPIRNVIAVRPAAEAAIAMVFPVDGIASVVTEVEAVVDRSPGAARVLLRLDPSPRVSIDAGVVAPVPLPDREWRPRIVGQARAFF